MLPALCRRCGASGQLLRGELYCRECGTRESLPPEQGALVGELQHRLFSAARTSLQPTGPLRSLSGTFERGPVVGAVAWSLFALGIAVTTSVVVDSWSQWQAVAGTSRAGLMTSALLLPAFVLAVPVSLVVARQVGRAHYRRIVRPHLLAWPPRAGARLARCRVCTADLPGSSERFVACRYCRSESIVGPDLFDRDRPSVEPVRTSSIPPRAPDLASWVRVAMGLSFAGSLIIAGCLLWLIYYGVATIR